MSRRMVVLVALAVGVAVVLLRRRSRGPVSNRAPADPPPSPGLVDLASEGSFPASDPPSYWGRDTDPA